MYISLVLEDQQMEDGGQKEIKLQGGGDRYRRSKRQATAFKMANDIANL